jgi:predicted nucleic acid-binding protein
MRSEVFPATAFALALVNVNDFLHAKALSVADQLEAQSVRLVTSRPVLLEIGNSLGACPVTFNRVLIVLLPASRDISASQ